MNTQHTPEYTIIENGDELTLTTEQFNKVADKVYYCDECHFYHLKNEVDLDMIEQEIQKIIRL